MASNQKIIIAINEQIGNELGAMPQYYAITVHFGAEALRELSAHFHGQAEEEKKHALRFIRFVIDTSVGLDQLFNVHVSAIKEDGQALTVPLKEDRTARAQTMLEAHEALIKTAPENLPKFKDVIQYLEEELHLSK